jgi:hypothetical protein
MVREPSPSRDSSAVAAARILVHEVASFTKANHAADQSGLDCLFGLHSKDERDSRDRKVNWT